MRSNGLKSRLRRPAASPTTCLPPPSAHLRKALKDNAAGGSWRKDRIGALSHLQRRGILQGRSGRSWLPILRSRLGYGRRRRKCRRSRSASRRVGAAEYCPAPACPSSGFPRQAAPAKAQPSSQPALGLVWLRARRRAPLQRSRQSGPCRTGSLLAKRGLSEL